MGSKTTTFNQDSKTYKPFLFDPLSQNIVVDYVVEHSILGFRSSVLGCSSIALLNSSSICKTWNHDYNLQPRTLKPINLSSSTPLSQNIVVDYVVEHSILGFRSSVLGCSSIALLNSSSICKTWNHDYNLQPRTLKPINLSSSTPLSQNIVVDYVLKIRF